MSNFDVVFPDDTSWKMQQKLLQAFCSRNLFFKKKGSNVKKKKNLRWEIFNFHHIMVKIFCIWFLSMKAFSSMSTDFLCLLLFLSNKGAKLGKYSIFCNMETFYFSSDFDGFFFFRSFPMRAFRSMSMITLCLLPFSR